MTITLGRGTFLEGLMRARFPDALVERLPHRNAWRVSVLFEDAELVSSRGEERKLVEKMERKLTPKAPRRRRLHWRKKWR